MQAPRVCLVWPVGVLQVPSWLPADTDYAASPARFDGTPAGSPIPNAVEEVGSVAVEAHGPGRWSGGPRYRYLGPRR